MKENSNTPLVSICCITYNHVAYIRQCIDGFIMQKTDFPFEIIIHDDCSTDGTVDIIREYQEKYPDLIKPIFQKENQYSQGVKSILATFVYPKCSGKYIALCEGDDYWIDENKLQMQVDFLEKNPEYGMCYTNFNKYFQRNDSFDIDIFNSDKKIKTDYTLEEWILSAGYIAPMSWVFKRELLDSIPKLKSLDGSFVMVACFLHDSKIKCFKDKVTCVYRVLDESAAHTRNIKKLYERNKSIIETQLSLIKMYKIDEKIKLQCEQKFFHSNFKLIMACDSSARIGDAFNHIQNKTCIEKILFFLSKNSLTHSLLANLYDFYWKYVGYKK